MTDTAVPFRVEIPQAELPVGGHVPAIEVPDLLVQELRAFVRLVARRAARVRPAGRPLSCTE